MHTQTYLRVDMFLHRLYEVIMFVIHVFCNIILLLVVFVNSVQE